MMRKAARTGFDRQAFVVVEGGLSEAFIIKDMFFQGAVIGPMLWNVFFADINDFVTSIDFEEQRFADDLSVFKTYDKNMSNDDILIDLHKAQVSIHEWGLAHQIAFD